MARITLEADTRELQRDLMRLGDRLAGAATASALNRALTAGRTEASRAIRDELTIKARDVNRDFTVRRAQRRKLQAELVMEGRASPLGRYRVRQTRRGASVKIFKRKPPIRFRHAFVATMASGHRGVFERGRSGERLPIHQLFSKAPVQVLEDEHVIERVGARAREVFAERLQHEVSRRL